MSETLATAYDSKIEGNVIFTRFDAALNWVRKNSLWPMPMGLACCAIELMAAAASRFDIARFGAEVMRFSPRQCDVMIVAGVRVAAKTTGRVTGDRRKTHAWWGGCRAGWRSPLRGWGARRAGGGGERRVCCVCC